MGMQSNVLSAYRSGIELCKNMIAAQRGKGIVSALKAGAVAAATDITGFTKGFGARSAFKEAWKSVKNPADYGRIVGHAAWHWWKGSSFAADGSMAVMAGEAVTRRAVLRQGLVYGAGAALTGKVLFGRHRRDRR